jgi:ubiquitin thioesterase protein OTUB1
MEPVADCACLQGPLVGEKTTSDTITEEYAKADQVYVAKTIVSVPVQYAQTFAQY